MVMIEYYNK